MVVLAEFEQDLEIVLIADLQSGDQLFECFGGEISSARDRGGDAGLPDTDQPASLGLCDTRPPQQVIDFPSEQHSPRGPRHGLPPY